MFLVDELPEGEDELSGQAPSEQAPARPQRHKVHPLTWVAAAALMPVLVYDVWQTLQDVKHRHHAYASHAYASPMSPPAAVQLRGHFE